MTDRTISPLCQRMIEDMSLVRHPPNEPVAGTQPRQVSDNP